MFRLVLLLLVLAQFAFAGLIVTTSQQTGGAGSGIYGGGTILFSGTTLNDPTSALYNPNTNQIMVADFGNNRIAQFDMSGAYTGQITPTTSPFGLGLLGTSLVYGSSGSFCITSAGCTTLGNAGQVFGIAVNGNNVYVSQGGFLYRYDATNPLAPTLMGAALDLSTLGISQGRGLAVYNNSVYLASNDGKISQFSLALAFTSTVLTGLQGPNDIAFDPGTGNLYIAEYTGNRVSMWNGVGSPTAVLTGITNATGIAFIPDVPEPGTFGLLGAGLVLAGVLHRRFAR